MPWYKHWRFANLGRLQVRERGLEPLNCFLFFDCRILSWFKVGVPWSYANYTYMGRLCFGPGAELRSTFATIRRSCWRLHLSENFSSGTKTPNKQTNKQTNGVRKSWILSKCQQSHWFISKTPYLILRFNHFLAIKSRYPTNSYTWCKNALSFCCEISFITFQNMFGKKVYWHIFHALILKPELRAILTEHL